MSLRVAQRPTLTSRSPHSCFAFDAEECQQLAARFGTPTFVYRAESVRRAWHDLRSALPDRVWVAYAVKANPFPDLLALLAAEGARFDVASGGELARLMRLGVEGSRLFFAGPGKRDTEIEDAVVCGVRLQAEGLEDLVRVDAIARRLGLGTVRVNLRVQPLGVEEAGPILGGSGPSAFGVDEEDLPELLAQARRLGRVRIHGLHGFAASNERDASQLLRNHQRMFDIGRALVWEHGLDLEQIDLGGGLGVPYTEEDAPLDVAALGTGLERLLQDNRWFQGEVILEPGRFLAAPCGVYLVRVIRTKTSRGEHFAILEAGINHLLRPLLTGQPFPVRAIDPANPGPPRPITLAGPLCTGLDRLGKVVLPPLSSGDLLAFGTTGAYAATEAMVPFLDHPPAKEVWWEDPDQTTVKENSTFPPIFLSKSTRY